MEKMQCSPYIMHKNYFNIKEEKDERITDTCEVYQKKGI